MEELQEIVVKRKKEKYSKKNNPAVDFVNMLRSSAPLHDPLRLPRYSFNNYEKLVLGSYIDSQNADSAIARFIDYSPLSGRSYLTLSLKEKIARHNFFSGKEEVIIDGYRTLGIDDKIDTDNMRKVLDDIMRPINLYANDVVMLQQHFVSPLSSIGPDFYKYYLTDTVQIGGQPCIELVFGPHNRESMGFSGRIYVPLGDTTMFVKKVVMQTPRASNINFVNGAWIVQNFEKDSIGYRHKVSEQLTVDLGILKGKTTLYARKESTSRDFNYNPTPASDIKNVKQEGSILTMPEAYSRPDAYWNTLRPTPLSIAQQSMPELMPQLRQKKWFFWGEKLIALMEKGYIRTDSPSKFDIGPLNTMLSYNEVEGLRLRAGGMTTASLSPHIFVRGYAAYGTRDHRWKYRAELEYSFLKKKNHAREFPMHLLRGEYSYDLDKIGQHYLFTNPDNAFLSFTRMKSILTTYRQLARIAYIHEQKSGFSIEAAAQWQRQHTTRWLPFIFPGNNARTFYNQSSLSLTLRYAPGEEFFQSASMRLPVNMDAPIIQLSQHWGPKGLLGANFAYIKTEISAMKRIWFSAFGYLDAIASGAKIWSKVYYPTLTWANANISYTIQPESYSLMNPMEFATDQYMACDLTYWGMGILFNRIPGIKKLGFREVITFKGYYGALSKRNNPEYTSNIPLFPTDAIAQPMRHGPYMEIGAGIDNIFKIMRIDYIWRLSYRHTPGTDRQGLRLSLHFSF